MHRSSNPFMKKLSYSGPLLLIVLAFLLMSNSSFSQEWTPDKISQLISNYKKDIRGPYKDIRWFCKDGSIRQPRDPCPDPGGHQRARYKDEVETLAKTNHIYLGQILSTTPFTDFWDEKFNHSRVKQYILEKYLQTVDNGWILQRGQYYRGAFQSEDESAWGKEFFTWLLNQPGVIEDQYFLVRQAVKYIPHGEETKGTENIRSLSKLISDSIPEFQDLRVKIHGQPEATDIAAVRDFYKKIDAKIPATQQKLFEKLISELETTFKPVDLGHIKNIASKIPQDRPISESINDYLRQQPHNGNLPNDFPAKTAELIALIRIQLPQEKDPKLCLVMLDLSIALEEIFFIENTKWNPGTPRELGEKICYTGTVVMGCGYIEKWEWDQVSDVIAGYEPESLKLEQLQNYAERANAVVQWGTGMVSGIYKDIIALYAPFEPLTQSFIDDQIRSSALLPLGNAVGRLSDFVSKQSDLTNEVLDLTNQNNISGLNPGVAKGRLVVVEGNMPESIEKDKIYAFPSAPSDLKPVAGILTVSEGNMVSHVQLLARNLAIPNANISQENLRELLKYQGREVFYAVAHSGRVIIKLANQMTADESQIFIKKERSGVKIRVPTEKIDLSEQSVLNMREIDASASGKICGPKAANLAQLKSIFPEHVVEGIVLPFGIFRAHLDQKMPEQEISYWEFLQNTFIEAEKIRDQENVSKADAFTLNKLSELRSAIKEIEFNKEFIRDLEENFRKVLGKNLGELPVFLRSDTNMEDLQDFTGAGLNLTVFNVVQKEDIINGIREVWASPYTERSFGWRQRYLLNPENVFPSILIIPSVDVDYSGVMITKGVNKGSNQDITVAFSRGAGGAVDGQAAESYLIQENGTAELLAPAREVKFRRLPDSGGTSSHFASFKQRILSEYNLVQLKSLAGQIKVLMPQYLKLDQETALDVELGFKENKIWLFQIRPFVENKNAAVINYLQTLSPEKNGMNIINMRTPIR